MVFFTDRILFVQISLETKKVAASLLAGVLPLCASTVAFCVTYRDKLVLLWEKIGWALDFSKIG